MGGVSRFVMLFATPLPSFLRLTRLSPRPIHHLHRYRSIHLSSASLLHTPVLLPSNSNSNFNSNSSRGRNLHIQSRRAPQANTHSTDSLDSSSVGHQHPWPEFSKLLDFISRHPVSDVSGNFEISPDDAFVDSPNLSHEFPSAARACLAFARKQSDLVGSLSRRDIEIVVTKGAPFLFESASESARRMKAYLASDGNTVSEFDKAKTVDLMKYLLSYAGNPTVPSVHDNIYNWELITSSCRNLLNEMAETSYQISKSIPPSPQQNQLSGRFGQTPRPFGQNVEMKRGDWICPNCNFMNFARNVKCLECEGPRPQRQLTGGEWECPQCDFFNYGRNVVCLRCDCKRPGERSLGERSLGAGLGYGTGDLSNKVGAENRLVANEEQVQSPFSKVSEIHTASDLSSGATVGQNLDRILGNLSIKSESGNGSMPAGQNVGTEKLVTSSRSGRGEQIPFSARPDVRVGSQDKEIGQAENLDSTRAISYDKFTHGMPMLKGHNRFVVSKRKDRSLTSPTYKRQIAMDQTYNSNFVPFVPFPPDYFAKKDKPRADSAGQTAEATTETGSSSAKPEGVDNVNDVQKSQNEQVKWNSDYSETSEIPTNSAQDSYKSQLNNVNNGISGFPEKGYSSGASNNLGSSSQVSKSQNSSAWRGESLEGSAVKESDPLDMSEEAKAERWFRRVAQIKDISELSQIPDEDFPSIMPMRKGVNRFVTSKRKTPLERRLTSPQYKRSLPVVSFDPMKEEKDES